MRRRCAGGCGKSMREWEADYCDACAYWHRLTSPTDITDEMEVTER